MLRRLRRLRQHIRYHSAPRPSNPWSRSLDWAFIATFLLAFPAAFLADFTVREGTVVMSLPGIVARSPTNAVDAWLMSGQNSRASSAGGSVAASAPPSRSAPQTNDRIIGNFTLTVTDVRRGWPLVTTIERQPAALTIDIVAERAARTDVRRVREDEFQVAIEGALNKDEQTEALSAWNLERSEIRRQWWAWFPAAGAWWIMLFAAAAITIQFLRFASMWLSGKRLERAHRRSAEGKCPQCGYDMTGLEFNAKCPECGGQVW